jgi:hypothetical protein
MDLREMWLEAVDWISMAEDSDRRKALVNTIMNLQVP